VLGGFRFKALTGKDSVFQVMIWYVLPEHRRYSVMFFKEIMKRLKAQGFNLITTACVFNNNFDRMITLYNRLGFNPLEMQFIRKL